jgi:hypothetical protein
MPRFGPDISHHQDRVDLARAKPHVDFVFLKATQSTGFVDDTFAKRWMQLADLRIPRGAYHFAIPSRSAPAQAAHFVSVVKQNGFRLGDVAILDMEQLHPNGVSEQDAKASNKMSARELAAWIDRFVKDVRQALSIENVVFYTGIPFWNGRMGHPPKLPAGCVGWLSRYRKQGPYGGQLPRPAAWPAPKPDIWQFTDGTFGNVRAITGIGKVDCNEMTEACFQRLFGASGFELNIAQGGLSMADVKDILERIDALRDELKMGRPKTLPNSFVNLDNIRDRVVALDKAVKALQKDVTKVLEAHPHT